MLTFAIALFLITFQAQADLLSGYSPCICVRPPCDCSTPTTSATSPRYGNLLDGSAAIISGNISTEDLSKIPEEDLDWAAKCYRVEKLTAKDVLPPSGFYGKRSVNVICPNDNSLKNPFRKNLHLEEGTCAAATTNSMWNTGRDDISPSTTLICRKRRF